MNRKMGMAASLVTLAAVVAFALSMLFGCDASSYLSSMFIAWGFVPMICAFAAVGRPDAKAAGMTAAAFASVYAVFIMLVYFAQLTTVRLAGLSAEAAQLLDYSKYGLLFNYDLLGYAFMALATFFIALTVEIKTTGDKWLKGLLFIHGIFAVTCVVMPILGIFGGSGSAEAVAGGAGADMAFIGVLILEFWCAYFTPVCILSFLHFKRLS
jgi:hypothetical protein